MRKLLLLLVPLLLLICLPLSAAVVPMTDATPGGVAQQPADGPQAGLRKFNRSQRKLAKEVIRDAAESCGMRRLEFLRAVDAGDRNATDELKLSLAAHEEVGEIDPDRLQEILQMILEFIKALLELFAMFADAGPVPYWMLV